MQASSRMTLGAFLISFSSLFVAIAGVSAATSGFWRMAIGAAVLLGWLFISRSPIRLPWRQGGALALAAFFFALDLSLWHQSILYVGPGLATLLANFQVFVMPLVAWALYREHLWPGYFIGALLAVAGLWLQVGQGWADFNADYRLGIWLGLGTALAYTAFMLTMKRVQQGNAREETRANLFWMSLFAAGFLGLAAGQEGQPLALPDLRAWVVMLAYGSLCQVLGWVLITGAMPRLPTARIALLLLLQPTFSYVWDVLFLHRPMSMGEVIGVCITLAGIYIGSVKKHAETS